MANSPTFTNAQAYRDYVEDFAPQLISKGFHSSPTSSRVMSHAGIKGKLVLTELILGTMARRWSKDFEPVADTVDFVPRELDVEPAKVELQFVPQLYETSYLGEMRRTGQNPDDLPFQAYMMNRILAKFAQEKEVALWKGVKTGAPTATDPLVDLFDGFLKHIADAITAATLTPYATPGGAWTDANIITGIEAMYSSLGAAYKEQEVEIWLSYELMEIYNRAYRDAHGHFMPGHDGRVKLDFGPAFFRPTPGLTGSNRIAITPSENFHWAYDGGSDDTMFHFEQNKRAMDFWMDFKIGTQIGILDDEIIAVNDLV